MGFRKILATMVLLGATQGFSQSPPAIPTTADAPCQDKPGTDDVSVALDSGFVSIFNGVDFKGWWNNCHGEDANHLNSSGGGIYKVDPVAKAMYTQQRATGPGGSALCTNKKYGNQEVILEYWADFGNDAGLYNRTADNAKAYQTVIDYKDKNCIGGSYPQEMGYLFYNCSYKFGASETAPFSGVQGDAGITDKSTLVPGDMYNPNGWNELRVKIYGNPPKHDAWMRKLGGTKWVKTLQVQWPASYMQDLGPTGYTAIQVHGNGYWNRTTVGNWYRNIRVRELDNTGNPIITTKTASFNSRLPMHLTVTAAGMIGWLERDYDITVTDLSGKVVETFHAKSGDFNHSFRSGPVQGVTLVHLKSDLDSRVIRAVPF